MTSLTTDLVYSNSGKPSPLRAFPVGGYDTTRDVFMIFGGVEGADFDVMHNDTWEWDRATNIWTQRQPIQPATLTERSNGGSAYDSYRQKFVQFGGVGPGPSFDVLGGTFEYDATGEGQWTEISTATVPLPRAGSLMTFDSIRNLVIMFGESTWDGMSFVDTNELWEYDGTDWSLAVPVTTGIYDSPPSPRRLVTVAYDPARQLTVVIGGFSPELEEVWLWDGTGWRQQTLGEKPTATHWVGGGAAFLASEGRIILLTGAANWSAPLASQLWGLDENGFQQFHPTPAPAHKSDLGQAVGSDGSRVYMFDHIQRLGPLIGGTQVITSELYTFDGLAHAEQRTGFEYDATQIEVSSGARLLNQP